MGLVSDNAKGSSAIKTPLVKKGAGSTSARDKKKSGGGMMFTFVHDDLEIKTFITEDPVFDGVVGFQSGFKFLTESMVEHIKSEIAKMDDDVSTSIYTYPLDHHQAVELMYNYTPLMKECKGGETAGASMVNYVDV